MSEKYEALINEIAQDAYDSFMSGGSSLYQIGRIPDIEFLDYNTVIKDIDEVFRMLSEQYMAFDDFGDYEEEEEDEF